MTGKFIVKKGAVSFEFPNTELATIDETPAGLAFTLKNGFHLTLEEPNMDLGMKATIIRARDITSGVIVIDLLNRKNPVSVNMM
jgi:hypothetical protein